MVKGDRERTLEPIYIPRANKLNHLTETPRLTKTLIILRITTPRMNGLKEQLNSQIHSKSQRAKTRGESTNSKEVALMT
jgi:hypothetical protein